MLDEPRRIEGKETAAADPADRRPLFDAETALAAPVDDQLVLVAGLGEEMSGALTALLNGDPAMPAKATVTSWPLARPQPGATHAFVAALQVAPLKRGRLASLLLRHHGRAVRYTLARRTVGAGALLAALSEIAEPPRHTVADRIVETLLPGPLSRRKLAAVAALVEAGARHDGYVEIVGGFEEGDIFLQGWSAHFGPGTTRVLLAGARTQIAQAAVATFHRDDLSGRAQGFAATLVSPEPIDAAALTRVFFRNREGWHSAEVYDRRILSGPRETPTHARAILARTRGPADVLAKLRAAAHRYDGTDTVSSLPIPVRLGLDHATRVEGGGVLIAGWLLDPDRRVTAVTLRRPRGECRLDADWTRLDRPDVVRAFEGKPPFGPGLEGGRHRHGFIAFAPAFDPDGTSPLHIELSFDLGPPAFLPVIAKRGSYREATLRQLRTIDPREGTFRRVVERQLVPLVEQAALPPVKTLSVEPIGHATAEGGVTLVIGLDEEATEVAPLLTLLALDPETRGRPIVIAAPVDLTDALGAELARLARFWRLSLRLVATDGGDAIDALIAGAAAAETETVLLLSGALVPGERGWLGQLVAAQAEAGGIVSPTFLYEDDSIRWAGPVFEDGVLVDRRAGYPAAALAHAAPASVAAANLECALLPRSTALSLEGRARAFLGRERKALDLALALAADGVPALWLPTVRLLSPEIETGGGTLRAHARRIDEIVFAARQADRPLARN
ncbi:hypothetical protein [Prosthecomicrobium pneumaticum]|uniref:Uncharacterized protein n=1 Tax=Prosthecomicrobium pneumaticum TaxID=81895 RepID=A0A7W9FM67_9HYPH|nr:hypothetical protein [Prosthecomicrobium pneumaticum]MBB5753225.1 hypothetical protein [Prosthecomicrobium pneumaticum]